VFPVPYFLIHLQSAFYNAFNGVNYIQLFDQEYRAVPKNIKSDLSSKCRDFTYKGLIKVFVGVALNHWKQFDLTHIIAKVFIFGVKNAIN